MAGKSSIKAFLLYLQFVYQSQITCKFVSVISILFHTADSLNSSIFYDFAFFIIYVTNKNDGPTQIFKTIFSNQCKWSFMTVAFAIPYLPQSMESGVRIVILGQLFRKPINHLLDGPMLVYDNALLKSTHFEKSALILDQLSAH